MEKDEIRIYVLDGKNVTIGEENWCFTVECTVEKIK